MTHGGYIASLNGWSRFGADLRQPRNVQSRPPVAVLVPGEDVRCPHCGGLVVAHTLERDMECILCGTMLYRS